MADIVERLRASMPLPACPYDKISPHYLTAPDDKPCVVCGGLNDPDAPDLCRGADTRIMGEAADEIERLRAELDKICGITLGSDPCDGGGKIHKVAREALSSGHCAGDQE